MSANVSVISATGPHYDVEKKRGKNKKSKGEIKINREKERKEDKKEDVKKRHRE